MKAGLTFANIDTTSLSLYEMTFSHYPNVLAAFNTQIDTTNGPVGMGLYASETYADVNEFIIVCY